MKLWNPLGIRFDFPNPYEEFMRTFQPQCHGCCQRIFYWKQKFHFQLVSCRMRQLVVLIQSSFISANQWGSKTFRLRTQNSALLSSRFSVVYAFHVKSSHRKKGRQCKLYFPSRVDLEDGWKFKLNCNRVCMNFHCILMTCKGKLRTECRIKCKSEGDEAHFSHVRRKIVNFLRHLSE